MPTSAPPGLTGTVGSPDANPSPSPDDVAASLSVEQTWHNWMTRRAVWVPQQIQKGTVALHGIDLITGRRSR